MDHLSDHVDVGTPRTSSARLLDQLVGDLNPNFWTEVSSRGVVRPRKVLLLLMKFLQGPYLMSVDLLSISTSWLYGE